MIRSWALILTGILLAATPIHADTLSKLPPADEYELSVELVRKNLAPYRTLSEMIVFAGALPERCIQVDRRSVICAWSLGKQQVGWQPLATALHTGDRLSLVCQFPADETPRVGDTCSAHAKRSNRSYYRSLNADGTSGGGALQLDAKQLLDRATTAFELSTLVGDAPTSCLFGDTESFCSWPTDAATYGHGTLARSIGAGYSQKVTLVCRLPLKGGARTTDACSVTVDG